MGRFPPRKWSVAVGAALKDSQVEHSLGVLYSCLFCVNLVLVFLEEHLISLSRPCLEMNPPILGTSTILFLTMPGVLCSFWPSDGQVCICLLQGTWRVGAIFDLKKCSQGWGRTGKLETGYVEGGVWESLNIT